MKKNGEEDPALDLDQVIRLLGILVLRSLPNDATQGERIGLLYSAGLSKQTIVELTGASAQTVANKMSEINVAAKKGKKG